MSIYDIYRPSYAVELEKKVAALRAENERLRAVIDAYLENDSQANWDAMAAALDSQPNRNRPGS